MMKQKSKTSIDLSKPILKVNNEPLQRSKERVAAKAAEKNARKYIIAAANSWTSAWQDPEGWGVWAGGLDPPLENHKLL